MTQAPWLCVVGIGEDGLAGLGSAARALIAGAETLAGSPRHLALVDGVAPAAERLAWATPLSHTIEEIARRRPSRVVVLASGDPLWYGIGVTLSRKFAPEEMIVLPHPGAFSLAASRLCWPLAEVETLTLHGRPVELLACVLAPGARILALSRDGATPAEVARYLTERGWGESVLTVLERLGGPAERRVRALAAEWGEALADDLNTIAIEARSSGAGPGARALCLARVPGLPDDAFRHDGQITKREVRAATLAALAPLPGALLWDIGAGAGSVAIEWMRAARFARAFAIERVPARLALIAGNAASLGVPGLELVGGEAPAALAGLPAPDAVFIGGGLGAPGMVATCWQALKPGGRLVANAVTLHGETALLESRARLGGELTRIAVARAGPVGAQDAWRPLLPVTQWAAVKPEARS